MADFPKSRIEAFERGEKCGLTARESDSLYLSKGEDKYNQFTAKQEKCFAGGPDQGFLSDMKGKLTGFFKESVAAVPKDLGELKEAVSPNSTAGLLRDQEQRTARQIDMAMKP